MKKSVDLTIKQIKCIEIEAKRLRMINEKLCPDFPEENYLLQINIDRLRSMEKLLDDFIRSREIPHLRLV